MFVTYIYNHLLFVLSDPRFPDPGKVEFVFGNNSEGLVQGMYNYYVCEIVPSTLHQNALITTETASKCTNFQLCSTKMYSFTWILSQNNLFTYNNAPKQTHFLRKLHQNLIIFQGENDNVAPNSLIF